jgi:hypothetical protein
MTPDRDPDTRRAGMPSRPQELRTVALSPSQWPIVARMALVALIALVVAIHIAARVT